MTFLHFTRLEPVSKFLWCIPLKISMIILGVFLLAKALYTIFEAKIYFTSTYVLGFASKEIFLVLEILVAILVFVIFFLRNRLFYTIAYWTTLVFAVFVLIGNCQKLFSLKLEENLGEDKVKTYIKFLYFFRVFSEFFIDLFVCFMVYSIKEEQQEEQKQIQEIQN